MSSFLIYSTYYASDDRTAKSVLVACAGISLSRFGYPNDEGLTEHRLYRSGLGNLNGFGEVKDSEFLKEYETMSKGSHERIWSGRGLSATKQAHQSKRHFIVSFKENVFEVICQELKIIGIFPDHSAALSEAGQKINLD